MASCGPVRLASTRGWWEGWWEQPLCEHPCAFLPAVCFTEGLLLAIAKRFHTAHPLSAAL